MTGNAINRKRHALFTASALVLLAVALSGCLGQPEEGGGQPTPTTPTPTTPTNGGGGNQGETPAWEETFEVTENATGLYLNLTIKQFEQGVNTTSPGQFEVRILDPDGNVVVSHNGTWQEEDVTVANLAINADAGPNGTAVQDVQMTGGKWMFQVWTDQDILVGTEMHVVDPTLTEEA